MSNGLDTAVSQTPSRVYELHCAGLVRYRARDYDRVLARFRLHGGPDVPASRSRDYAPHLGRLRVLQAATRPLASAPHIQPAQTEEHQMQLPVPLIQRGEQPQSFG